MAAILFKAHLVDEHNQIQAELARILFGVNSLAEKEQAFRHLCAQKYSHLRITEPLSMAPARFA